MLHRKSALGTTVLSCLFLAACPLHNPWDNPWLPQATSSPTVLEGTWRWSDWQLPGKEDEEEITFTGNSYTSHAVQILYEFPTLCTFDESGRFAVIDSGSYDEIEFYKVEFETDQGSYADHEYYVPPEIYRESFTLTHGQIDDYTWSTLCIRNKCYGYVNEK